MKINNGETLPIDGEMAQRIRDFDWSKTPVGPSEAWSPALRMMVRFLLANRFPLLLWWGPEYVSIYNDAYRPILGSKHPWALGQPVKQCWKEIWPILQPLIDTPFRGGPATWNDDLQLEIRRHGFTEETHFTIAYSPVPDDTVASGIGGVLATVHEITGKVVGDRRVVVLRDLAARSGDAKTTEEACSLAATTLAAHAKDIPFVLLYLIEPDRKTARLAASRGVMTGSLAGPATISLEGDDVPNTPWPLAAAMRTEEMQSLTSLSPRLTEDVPPGPWSDPPHTAVVVPIPSNKAHYLAGFLVAGVSARLRLDTSYCDFLYLVAAQIVTAITNAREHEEEKKRAEALAELDQAKTLFFSNVSHEFRTPLTLLLGPIEDLLSRSYSELAPTAKGQLEVAHRNALRLVRLVNTLLDFSRIESGRVHAAFEPTDLATFTADLAGVFRAATERAGLKLIVDCPALPKPVWVDRDMWEKIVLNLISNAFKFTFEGEIAITLQMRGEHAELRVRDTGVGIPAEAMPHLFERFHRVPNMRSRTHEGSGIGLALVHELVKLHKGSVHVESRLGEGSLFVVRIPLGKAHHSPNHLGARRPLASPPMNAAPFVEEAYRWLPDEPTPLESKPEPATLWQPRPRSASTNGTRPRLLVADDNADMRQYLARLLTERYDVQMAPDGRAALVAARKAPPDLILSDIMMPYLDGVDLLREIRSDPALKTIPVILLSARAGEESRLEGLQKGADDYLIKPFNARELLARVAVHLDMVRLRHEAAEVIHRSEERFRALVEASSDFVYRMNPDWTEMQPILGRDAIADTAEPSRSWLEKYIPPEDQAHVMATIQEAIRTKGVFELEHRVKRVDGRVGWTFSRAVPILDDQGEIVEWFGTASDITEAHETREYLRRQAELLDLSPDTIFIRDEEDRIMYWNKSAELRYGWTAQEVLGKFAHILLNTKFPMPLEQIRATVLRTGSWSGELLHTSRAGQVMIVESRWALQRDERGQGYRFLQINNDITERKRAEAEREKFVSLAEHSIEFIGMCDLDFKPFYVNKAGRKLVGLDSMEQACNVLVQDYFFPEDQDYILHEFFPKVLSEGRGEIEIRFRHFKTGAAIWMIYDVFQVRCQDGKPIGYATVSHDITERKRVEEALLEADRRKDEFLATLAHELRNPLAPIAIGLELLKKAGDNPVMRDKVRGTLERQTDQLVTLVNDLLDVSRITRGKLELRKTRVQLGEIVRSAVESAQPLIDKERHELRVNIPEEPLYLNGDRHRLAQVLSNLLNNAARYTPEKGAIDLTAQRQGNTVLLTVRDNGIGIRPEMREHIFDMFTQADYHHGRAKSGLGIGLTLVKTLVEMHGGTVEVHSEGINCGSEFRVRLPLVSEQNGAVVQSLDKPNEVDKAPRRVLVVDDNDEAARTLMDLLEMSGHEVRMANDGEQAIQVAAEFRPEIILMDLGMPKLNGYDAARAIRRQAWGKDILMVALTGWGQVAARQRTKDAGFDHHLVKPPEPDEIERLISTFPSRRV